MEIYLKAGADFNDESSWEADYSKPHSLYFCNSDEICFGVNFQSVDSKDLSSFKDEVSIFLKDTKFQDY